MSDSLVCRSEIDFLSTQQTNPSRSAASEFILTLLSGSHKKPFSEGERERKKIYCKIKITLQHAYLN